MSSPMSPPMPGSAGPPRGGSAPSGAPDPMSAIAGNRSPLNKQDMLTEVGGMMESGVDPSTMTLGEMLSDERAGRERPGAPANLQVHGRHLGRQRPDVSGGCHSRRRERAHEAAWDAWWGTRRAWDAVATRTRSTATYRCTPAKRTRWRRPATAGNLEGARRVILAVFLLIGGLLILGLLWIDLS